MKSVRIVGLCLAAMFVMSMVAAETASAAPHWLVCLPETSGSTATKWESHQCEKAKASGGWEWSELKNTELPVRTHGTLRLHSFSSLLNKEISVSCSGTDKGTIGPGNKSTTTVVTAENCTAGENCEKIEGTPKAVNLPWSSEMLETEGKLHDTITNGTESKAPGYTVTCRVSGVTVANECTTEKGLVVLSNGISPGAEPQLLVLADFLEPNKPEANCTSTGTETGDVLGSIGTSLENKWGLRVSK